MLLYKSSGSCCPELQGCDYDCQYRGCSVFQTCFLCPRVKFEVEKVFFFQCLG